MKSWAISFVMLLAWTAVSFGQGNTRLKHFNGGKYNIDVSLTNSLFLGIGSKVGSMGGDYGGLYSTSESILWNPANLSFIEKSQFTIDFQPTLKFNPQDYVDLDKEIRKGVDDGIKDLKEDDFILGDSDYPNLKMNIGEKGSLGTGSFAFKNGSMVIGGALFQPLHLTSTMVGSGLALQITTEDKDDPTKDVTLSLENNFSLSTEVKVEGISLAIAQNLTKNWGFGFAYNRISGLMRLNARFQNYAIVSTAGNEQSYNDDNDPWDNDLHSSIIGQYRGTSESYKIGSTLKLSKHWGIGSVVSMNNNLRMKGKLNINLKNLRGLKLDGKEDEDFLDPTKMDLDELTKTFLEDNPTGDEIILKFPNSVGVGISGKLLFIRFSFSYLQYSGEYGYEYAVSREDGERIYTRGFKPENSLRGGIDLKLFRVGAGLMTGKILDPEKEEENEEIILPTASVGTGIRITKSLSVDFLISAVPSGVGKLSFNYKL